MEHVVLADDFGRYSVKVALLIDGQELTHTFPSLAVPAPFGADPDGDPLERITYNGRTWLTGRRALSESPDALWRTSGSKTEGQALEELRIKFMASLAWAAEKVDIEGCALSVVTSAPDSEYDRALPGLKEALGGTFEFSIGSGIMTPRAQRLAALGGVLPKPQQRFTVNVDAGRVSVARESVAPFWAQIWDARGEYLPQEQNQLMWTIGGRPPNRQAFPARVLVVGLGFRDFNLAILEGGRRLDSRSGRRGVEEVYASIWEAVTGPDLGISLRSRAEIDSLLEGSHPAWTHRDPDKLEAILQRTIHQKGSSLLAEAVQWAGNVEDYHLVLAAGGGCLLLKDLAQATFPKAKFAAQIDSARGLAYAGVRNLRPKS